MLLATVNEAAMVPFVSQQLNNLDLALSMAKRGNLPGAEGLIAQQFEKLFAAGQYKEAAECAAESPQVSVPRLRPTSRLGWLGLQQQAAGARHPYASRGAGWKQFATAVDREHSSTILATSVVSPSRKEPSMLP